MYRSSSDSLVPAQPEIGREGVVEVSWRSWLSKIPISSISHKTHRLRGKLIHYGSRLPRTFVYGMLATHAHSRQTSLRREKVGEKKRSPDSHPLIQPLSSIPTRYLKQVSGKWRYIGVLLAKSLMNFLFHLPSQPCSRLVLSKVTCWRRCWKRSTASAMTSTGTVLPLVSADIGCFSFCTSLNVDFLSAGISVQTMDTSHVCLVSLELNSDGFEPYRCDRNITLGLKAQTWDLLAHSPNMCHDQKPTCFFLSVSLSLTFLVSRFLLIPSHSQPAGCSFSHVVLGTFVMCYACTTVEPRLPTYLCIYW